MRWIVTALTSSVGRKIVLGLTGLLLVGFLAEHLLGNLKLYESPEAFNDYVEYLQSFGPLLLVAEIALAALFLCHIVIALKLAMENREARKARYAVRGDHGAQSVGSISMHVTGILLLGYLIKHLLDFRFDGNFFDDPAASVSQTLAQPVNAVIYLAAAVVVGIHLSHGFRSAFQSIGASHPKLDPALQKLGILLAALFAMGFASFPIYFLLNGSN